MAELDAAPTTARRLDEMHATAIADGPAFDIRPSTADQNAVDLDSADKEEADTCRICRGEGSADEPLFYPCKCSGSIKYVHQECLMEWLSHTQKKHCELCKTSFRFTKLYHPGMPTRIPTAVFIRRAAMHVVNMFLTWCRAVLVSCVWLLLLPWCMRIVWRSLFWVGDGGWSSEFYRDSSNMTANPRLSPFNMTALHVPPPSVTSRVTPNQSGTIWNLALSYNASATEPALWTFAKRLLFGFSPLLVALPISEENQKVANATSNFLGIRSPSLLSDVPFFDLFASQTANRFIIDVLEGQIITLLVVVAFILIFLIREWVVQQQPVINMVALGDNIAPRAVDQGVQVQQAVPLAGDHVEQFHNAQDEIVGVQELEVDHEQSEEEEDEDAEEEGYPLLEEDDVAPSIEGVARANETSRTADAALLDAINSEANSAAFPRRSSRLRQQNQAEDSAILDSPESSHRPLMPERDRSFMATNIRRGLEEGRDWSFENLSEAAPREDTKAGDVPNAWDDEELDNSQLDRNAQAASDQGQDSEHSSESWQQVAAIPAEHDSDQVLEGDRTQDKGKAKAKAVGSDEGPLSSREAEHGEQGTDTLDTEEPHNIDPSTDSRRGSRMSMEMPVSRGSDAEPPVDNINTHGNQPQVPDPVAPVQPVQQLNAFDQVFDWMFGDVAPAIPQVEETGNEEHVVRNLAEEAPFVPFAGNEPQEPANAQAQDPDVAAAAAQAGIDVNDQEAIEDAEDLEGILELIGMQGPIVGLFQNVLFSAVLISATLACAVWLPYLWGKVVLLFMGSPIALLIKLPLQIIATLTDLIVDIALMIMAGITYWGSQMVSSVVHLCATGTLPQVVDSRLAAISATMRGLAEGALDRIAKALVDSPLSPRPDYFRLSVNSHVALRSLQNSTSFALNETSTLVNAFIEQASTDSPFRFIWRAVIGIPYILFVGSKSLYAWSSSFLSWIWTAKSYRITLDLDLGHDVTPAYTSLERWTANDRMIAIFAGYAFFAVAGAVYLKRNSPFSSSQQGQSVERIISDILQQAGGVLKVILIISIEMLAFPLYCGLLLDLAMLPLFQNATLYTRWQFACTSPWTSGFVHWFIGTCYMFHFALFVSMCRKIMRKGVLYFIRDPDDPTFHPVRDVLERSVTTQLRKIAFSALVYGALVIVCLGGVVWTLSRATSGILPIHWTTEAPSLEFPLDLLFYNFLTPVIIKFYKPSEGVHAVYKWCFMKCAGLLRLSSFLFGSTITAREGDSGKFVRAPASDQARIPKGQPVFVEVTPDNVRKDGVTEGGVHNSNLVSMVYIPNWFRLRIFAFVVSIWVLMGMSGVGVTILPLLFGRYLFSFVLPDTVEMNDIHAFSLGIYTLGSIAYSAYHAYKFISSLNRSAPSPLTTLQTVATTTSRVGLRILRFTYVWIGLIFAIPLLFAVLIELYFLMPIHAYLGPSEPHVVHIIQDWTLGFLYSRIAARLIFANRQSRPARAFEAVVRDGYLYPNARIATRCFLLPVVALWLIAIAIPSSLAWTTSRTLYAGATEQTRNMVWRFSFPAVGLSLVALWASKEAVRMLTRWRLVVRDEVYLIGERLHNFGERKAPAQSRAMEEKIEKAANAEHEGVVGEAR